MRGHTFRRARRGTLAVAGADVRVDAGCFADEVIVDFPSVAPALERFRNAFLFDERRALLHAAVAVTASEARTGAWIPLEVPVRCTCRDCGGRGESWSAPCGRCTGSGIEMLRHQLQVSIPAGVANGDLFHFTVTPRHDSPTRIELEVRVRS